MAGISRKGFILGTLTAAGGVVHGDVVQGGGFHESARNLPLTEDADLIVAGGGPAGIAAAITAARMGKRVRLFEAHGALGGLWTVGMISCVNDFGRGTLTKEITRGLEARGARHERFAKPRDDWYVYEPEYMEPVSEAGVAAFVFTIMDGETPVSIAQAKVREMVRYAATLTGGFEPSTAAEVAITSGGTSFTAELKRIDGRDSGFMKVELK